MRVWARQVFAGDVRVHLVAAIVNRRIAVSVWQRVQLQAVYILTIRRVISPCRVYEVQTRNEIEARWIGRVESVVKPINLYSQVLRRARVLYTEHR